MQKNLRRMLKPFALATLCASLVVAMGLSLVSSSPVDAQAPAPTGTPVDPAWRGFSAAREALTEARGVDVRIVQEWTYEQVEWQVSIDSCVEATPESEYRSVYFGWNFRITALNGTQYRVRVAYDLSAVVVCDRETNDSVVNNNPPADGLPAPVAGGAVSGAFELGGHVDGLTEEAKNAMNTAGMTWMKKQVRYNLGDGQGTVQNFVGIARANGYKVLLGIVGNPQQLGSNFDDYVNQYAAFVGEAAASGVDAIEVWNEPNIDREWPAGQINGANYTKLLAASYNAIKSKNPNTIVISGAPAPTGFFGAAGCTDAGCNDDVFMAQMRDAGAGQYMDCVGLHYNEGIVAPSASSGDSRGSYPTYFFGSMTARGDLFGKPICYTELGYLSGEGFNTPISAGFAWAQNTTVAQHASWLAEAATIAAQSGRVRLMIVWNVNFKNFGADPMAGYAIIRADGTCPACAALGTAMGK